MATGRSCAFGLSAVAGVLLALAGCGAERVNTAGVHGSSPPIVNAPFQGAPVIPAKDSPGPSAAVQRVASGTTWLVQPGDEYYSKAETAVVIPDTHDLQLSAGEKEFSWAIFGFNKPDPSFQPGLVHVRFVNTPPAALWLGAADYATQRWEWHLLKPIGDNVELDFPVSGAWTNAAGGSFFALGVWDGGAAAIGSCSVQGVQADPAPTGGWPMFGHDARHSHQSQYNGPQDASLQWSFETGQPIKSGPVVSADGVVYFGCDDGYLYALNPQGTLKWRYDLGGRPATCPALDAAGNVYCAKWVGRIVALNPEGTLLWSADAAPVIRTIGANITLAGDGTLYYCSSDLVALDLSGNVKWSCASGGWGDACFTPAVGPSGVIYFGDTDTIVAANPDGSVKWSQGYLMETDILRDACLGIDESLFMTTYDGSWHSQRVLLKNTLGNELWHGTTDTHAAVAVASDGTVYLNSSGLEALDTARETKWTFAGVRSAYSSPAIGADGTVYACSDLEGSSGVYAIAADGSLKWSYSAAEKYASSPAIGPNGVLYVGSDSGKLYAFGVPPSD
jgi:outer membrane protein assembly factor BamB